MKIIKTIGFKYIVINAISYFVLVKYICYNLAYSCCNSSLYTFCAFKRNGFELGQASTVSYKTTIKKKTTQFYKPFI